MRQTTSHRAICRVLLGAALLLGPIVAPAVAAPEAPAPAAKPTQPTAAAKPAAATSKKPEASKKTDAAKKPEAGKPAQSKATPAAPAKPAQAAIPAPAKTPKADTKKQAGKTPAASPAPVARKRSTEPPRAPLTFAPTAGTSVADMQLVKQAIDESQANKASAATQTMQSIQDPLARKLVEWAILRGDGNGASFARYNAFIVNNPSWPGINFMRRRAEAMLWTEKPDTATVQTFFAQTPPLTSKGRFAQARALVAMGDRANAQRLVREGWRSEGLSSDLEDMVIDQFSELLSAADHKTRMDARLYAEDIDGSLRAAKRLGANEMAIAKARIAVIGKAKNAKALLDAVPAAARHDAGYIFSHSQWLRRSDKQAEAAQLLLTAPKTLAQVVDPDEWWVERRLVARALLDQGNARLAYQITRDAVPPTKENYRAEHQFTAGWIALRFLKDASAAAQHFARIAPDIDNPIAKARAGYWQGRAAEAAGRQTEARQHYAEAAKYPTAYYGQIARAKLGMQDLSPSMPPALSSSQRANYERLEVLRAVALLYAIEERDLVIPVVIDLADRISDVGALTALADLCVKNNDARATLFLGKTALGRDLPFAVYAFPTFGMPKYETIGPPAEPALVYSIARQESTFNQRTVSRAKAMGLMQVTPDAGRYIAKKFNVGFDEKKLLSDPVYNVQMGAAELADLVKDYRGSYILSFVGYNAGRGRVRDWNARFGDPRDPGVDAIDWVERIPFSETRNYVQRIMENVQIYRTLFGGGSRLLIEADLRRGTVEN